jgi:hypothetical protein
MLKCNEPLKRNEDMLKFDELVEGVEYRVINDSHGAIYKIAENGNLLVRYGNGKYLLSSAIYNDLINVNFEECEWMPKRGELYYFPSFSESTLYDTDYWNGVEEEINILRNVGIYRTKEEAIAKAKELGWT